MSKCRVAVSVSWGSLNDENYTESTHMLSFTEVELDERTAKALKEMIVAVITSIKDGNETVLGIYKEENPNQLHG